MYFLIPVAIVLIVGLLCLNVKIGFIVADRTRGTGFEAGYYMITVFGLVGIEIATLLTIFDYFK